VSSANECEAVILQNVTMQMRFIYLHLSAMTSQFGTGSATGAVAGSRWAGLAPRVESTWPGRYFRCRDRQHWHRRRRRRCGRWAEAERHLAELAECWHWLGVRGHYYRPRALSLSCTPSTIYFLSQPAVGHIFYAYLF